MNLAESHKGVDNMKKVTVLASKKENISESRRKGREYARYMLKHHKRLMDELKKI